MVISELYVINTPLSRTCILKSNKIVIRNNFVYTQVLGHAGSKGVARCTQQHCWCTQHFIKMPIFPSLFFFKLATLCVLFYVSSFVSFIFVRFLPFVVVFASVERVSGSVKVKLLPGGVFFSAEVHIL